jgi:hypothetical protein
MHKAYALKHTKNYWDKDLHKWSDIFIGEPTKYY